jgi:hypothetical protein
MLNREKPTRAVLRPNRKTIATGFDAKLEETVATGFEAKLEKIIPVVLRSNH